MFFHYLLSSFFYAHFFPAISCLHCPFFSASPPLPPFFITLSLSSALPDNNNCLLHQVCLSIFTKTPRQLSLLSFSRPRQLPHSVTSECPLLTSRERNGGRCDCPSHTERSTLALLNTLPLFFYIFTHCMQINQWNAGNVFLETYTAIMSNFVFLFVIMID